MKPSELQKRKKPELVALAKEAGIRVTTRMTKAQVLSALTLHYTAQNAVGATRPRPPQPAATSPEAPAKQPAAAGPAAPDTGDLPARYQEDRLVLMVRDPRWVHAYWELTDEALGRARRYFGPRWESTRLVLRVYDVAGVEFDGGNARSSFDIELNPAASNWYVNVPEAARAYCVEIGVLGAGDDFFALARSNRVEMPPEGVSEVVDEQWTSREEESERVYARSAGAPATAGSAELAELMERRLREEVASGFVSSLASMGMAPERGRGFRFMVDAELIIYGATEADATVTVQGRPVPLRRDGTFTLRFALPDGRQIVPAVAASRDGAEERTITLSFSRRTETRRPRSLQPA